MEKSEDTFPPFEPLTDDQWEKLFKSLLDSEIYQKNCLTSQERKRIKILKPLLYKNDIPYKYENLKKYFDMNQETFEEEIIKLSEMTKT